VIAFTWTIDRFPYYSSQRFVRGNSARLGRGTPDDQATRGNRGPAWKSRLMI
jgi:hypothetical protein